MAMKYPTKKQQSRQPSENHRGSLVINTASRAKSSTNLAGGPKKAKANSIGSTQAKAKSLNSTQTRMKNIKQTVQGQSQPGG